MKLSSSTASNVAYTAAAANSSFYFPAENKYLLVSGTSALGASVMGYGFQNGSNYEKFPIIPVTSDSFILSLGISATTAITVNTSDPTSLTTAALNKADPNQQWKFAVASSNCPNNCSNHGVCSYSSGSFLNNLNSLTNKFYFNRSVCLCHRMGW